MNWWFPTASGTACNCMMLRLQRIFVTDKKEEKLCYFDTWCYLRILTGKKHPQIKLHRFQIVWIWTFGWSVHQINFLYEVLKLKQSFWKNKLVTGKTPSFVIGSLCTLHSICLNICFWQSSFVWKCCVFNFSTFN